MRKTAVDEQPGAAVVVGAQPLAAVDHLSSSCEPEPASDSDGLGGEPSRSSTAKQTSRCSLRGRPGGHLRAGAVQPVPTNSLARATCARLDAVSDLPPANGAPRRPGAQAAASDPLPAAAGPRLRRGHAAPRPAGRCARPCGTFSTWPPRRSRATTRWSTRSRASSALICEAVLPGQQRQVCAVALLTLRRALTLAQFMGFHAQAGAVAASPAGPGHTRVSNGGRTQRRPASGWKRSRSTCVRAILQRKPGSRDLLRLRSTRSTRSASTASWMPLPRACRLAWWSPLDFPAGTAVEGLMERHDQRPDPPAPAHSRRRPARASPSSQAELQQVGLHVCLPRGAGPLRAVSRLCPRRLLLPSRRLLRPHRRPRAPRRPSQRPAPRRLGLGCSRTTAAATAPSSARPSTP